jgi:hypothetical protein
MLLNPSDTSVNIIYNEFGKIVTTTQLITIDLIIENVPSLENNEFAGYGA